MHWRMATGASYNWPEWRSHKSQRAVVQLCICAVASRKSQVASRKSQVASCKLQLQAIDWANALRCKAARRPDICLAHGPSAPRARLVVCTIRVRIYPRVLSPLKRRLALMMIVVLESRPMAHVVCRCLCMQTRSVSTTKFHHQISTHSTPTKFNERRPIRRLLKSLPLGVRESVQCNRRSATEPAGRSKAMQSPPARQTHE